MRTYAYSETFTRTEARYLASKVVSDLHQCTRLYGRPSLGRIRDYEAELVELLVKDYLLRYEFGFKKDDSRIVCWQYEVTNGDLTGGSDDRSGGVYARADVEGASYYNFACYSDAWFSLSHDEREAFKATVPFTRGDGHLPDDGDGYWIPDKTYFRGGVAVARRTFRPL